MVRFVIALTIVAIAAGVAQLVSRRRRRDPPTQPHRQLPTQLDRADFDRAHFDQADFDGANPDGETVPWLVAVFSSEACATCADVIAKAEVLRSDEVIVVNVPFQTARDVHERYAIDAVPCLLIADSNGVVRAGFLGPVTATDLWAAVAECRQPGSIDRQGECGGQSGMP
jgi:hypothetical protein